MKSTTTTVIAITMFAVIAFATALPARKSMVYLQQPAAQWRNGPQRLMYVQYVQPSQTHARSTQAAEVLVAGDSVATGTYLKDCDHEESDVAAAGPAIDAAGAENVEVAASVDALEVDVEDAAATAADEVNNVEDNVLSVAEAYPEEPKVEVDVEATAVPADAGETESADDDAKVPRELSFDAEEPAAAPAATDAAEEPAFVAADEPAVEAAAEPAVETAAVDVGGAAVVPAVVVPAAKRFNPVNKKVFVELEQPAAADIEDEGDDDAVAVDDDNDTPVQADDDEEDEAPAVVPVRPARRPVRKPGKAAQPAARPTGTKSALPTGTFFPINFGGTTGGAIAIANSFSTGEGGSATSHAIAYGSPDAARAAHARPSKKH